MATHEPSLAPSFALRLRIYGYVALAATVGVLISFCCRSFIPPAAFKTDTDVVGNYLQFIGGVYAFIIGFVIFAVWNQFNDATRVIEHESGRLGALARLSKCLADIQHAKTIRSSMRHYIGGILKAHSAAV